jgi:type IV pilus assembly protein PilA
MQLKLTFKTTGESWILKPNKEYIIGRDESCDITLPTVVTISFHHLKLLFNQLTNQWHIEDLNSSNGTFVDNQRIRNAVIEGITNITLSHEVHLVAVPEVKAIATLVSPNATVISPGATSANTVASFDAIEPQAATPRRKRFPLKGPLTRLGIGGILITGLFSAVAAPSFLNQANKAKQSQGKILLGELTRAQQTHYLHESRFTKNVDELKELANRMGGNSSFSASNMVSDTINYTFSIYPIGTGGVQQVAMPKPQNLRTYTSISRVSGASSDSVLCESRETSVPVNFLVSESALASSGLTCPPGFLEIGR